MAVLCMSCLSEDIQEIVKDNHRHYLCKSCQKVSERAHDSRYGKMLAIKNQTGVVHHSVGGFIMKDNRYLVIKRRGFPFGYSIPAGHQEYNEDPIEALNREVFEETGLRIKNADLIFTGELTWNKCRYGADSHRWHFYKIECEEGVPILSAECEAIGWYTLEEARALSLVPVAKYFFGEIAPV